MGTVNRIGVAFWRAALKVLVYGEDCIDKFCNLTIEARQGGVVIGAQYAGSKTGLADRLEMLLGKPRQATYVDS